MYKCFFIVYPVFPFPARFLSHSLPVMCNRACDPASRTIFLLGVCAFPFPSQEKYLNVSPGYITVRPLYEKLAMRHHIIFIKMHQHKKNKTAKTWNINYNMNIIIIINVMLYIRTIFKSLYGALTFNAWFLLIQINV